MTWFLHGTANKFYISIILVITQVFLKNKHSIIYSNQVLFIVFSGIIILLSNISLSLKILYLKMDKT